MRALLILFIVTIRLTSQPYGHFIFRRIRTIDLKDFFIQKEGQFIPYTTLVHRYGSQSLNAELRKLVDKGLIIEINAQDFGLKGVNFAFYCMPRRRVVSEAVSKEISDLLSDAEGRRVGAHFVQLRSPQRFKQELIHILSWNYFRFQGVVSDPTLQNYYWSELIPTLFALYGDNLEKLTGRLDKILQGIESYKTLPEKKNALERILREEKEWASELKTFLNSVNPSEKLKNVVRILHTHMDEFEQLVKENGDVFVGFLIFGSWAYLLPSPHADLDLILISKGELSMKSYNAIKVKLDELFAGQIENIQCLTYPAPDLNNPETFSIFNYPQDAPLYIRNFILITNSPQYYREILLLIQRYYYPNIFNF